MEDLPNRVARLEWEIQGLKDANQRQDARVDALGDRMDGHHREVMAAIGRLMEDHNRRAGADAAVAAEKERQHKVLKTVSIIMGIIAALASIGWITTPADASPPPPPHVRDESHETNIQPVE